MSATIDRLLQRYESGRITRRDLVRSLAALAAAPQAAPAQAPIPVRTLNHVTLNVSNMTRSVEFYQKLLGMPVMSRQDTGVNLAAGSSFVGLYPTPGDGRPQINHFCLGVEKFDAAGVMRALEAHGVRGRIRMRGDVQELYFRDPDDLQVQLQDVSYRG